MSCACLCSCSGWWRLHSDAMDVLFSTYTHGCPSVHSPLFIYDQALASSLLTHTSHITSVTALAALLLFPPSSSLAYSSFSRDRLHFVPTLPIRRIAPSPTGIAPSYFSPPPSSIHTLPFPSLLPFSKHNIPTTLLHIHPNPTYLPFTHTLLPKWVFTRSRSSLAMPPVPRPQLLSPLLSLPNHISSS